MSRAERVASWSEPILSPTPPMLKSHWHPRNAWLQAARTWALACTLVANSWLLPPAQAAPEVWAPPLPGKGLSLHMMKVEAHGLVQPYVRLMMRPVHTFDRDKRKLVLAPWAAKLGSRQVNDLLKAGLGLQTAWGLAYLHYSRHPKVKMTFAPTKGEPACPQDRGVRDGIPNFSTAWFWGLASAEDGELVPRSGARAIPAGDDGDTDATRVARAAIKKVLGPRAREMVVDAVALGTAGRVTQEFLKSKGIAYDPQESLKDTLAKVLADPKDERAHAIRVKNWDHLRRMLVRHGTFWEFGRFWLDRDHGRFIRDQLFAPMLLSGIALGVHEGRAPKESEFWTNYTTAGARSRLFSGFADYADAIWAEIPYYDTELAKLIRWVAFQIVGAQAKIEGVERHVPKEAPRNVSEVFEYNDRQILAMTLGEGVELNTDQQRKMSRAKLDVPPKYSIVKQLWLPDLTLPEDYHKRLILVP